MLDAALTALAAAAGKAVVQAMATDSWVAFRDRIAQIFSGGDSERERQVAGQLSETRDAIRAGHVEAAVAAGRWQGRLETLLENQPEAAVRLEDLIEKIGRSDSQQTTVQQISAGNRARINQAGRDINNTNTKNKRTSYGGPLAVIAVIAVVLALGWGATKIVVWVRNTVNSATITENTSCRDYLKASTEDRDHAVKTIGVEKGATGAGNPMARLNVDYECGQSPDTPVGKVIAKQNY